MKGKRGGQVAIDTRNIPELRISESISLTKYFPFQERAPYSLPEKRARLPRAMDFDLSLTGFDPPEIDGFLFPDEVDSTEENIPEPCQEAITKLGDLWLCGPHRVLCGDATSEEVVHRLLDVAEPALMVTDPPYGVQLDPEWRERAGLGRTRSGSFALPVSRFHSSKVSSEIDWIIFW